MDTQEFAMRNSLKGGSDGPYRLDSLSKKYLGQNKEDINFKEIRPLQEGTSSDRRKLAVYCLKVSFSFIFFPPIF